MRVGLTLFGDHLTEDGARYASQLGVSDIVIHLTQYARNADNSAYRAGGVVGPINGECIDVPLWTYDHMAGVVSMLGKHGLKVAALENLSPNFWSDILLDGPKKHEQMDGLKQLVRDAGRAGIPVLGYNFSIAGVWGWQRKRVARGGAMTAVFFGEEFDQQQLMPDGMLWNMRYRPAASDGTPINVSEAELWSRLEWFLKELVPVAEKANVRLAAHPDDPPVEPVCRVVGEPGLGDTLVLVVVGERPLSAQVAPLLTHELRAWVCSVECACSGESHGHYGAPEMQRCKTVDAGEPESLSSAVRSPASRAGSRPVRACPSTPARRSARRASRSPWSRAP